MKVFHCSVICTITLLLGIGLVGCGSSEKIAAISRPPPVTSEPLPVNPGPPVDNTPSPTLRPTPPPDPAVLAGTGSNSAYELWIGAESTFDQNGRETDRTYYGGVYELGTSVPFAEGTEECSFPWACEAFGQRLDAEFEYLRIAILNEDGSLVRDAADGVLDGMHNGSQYSDCPSDGPCTEQILWRTFGFTDSTTSAPDTIAVRVYVDQGETRADTPNSVNTDVYPISHHLDYLKLGHWMVSRSGGSWEHGGAFYNAYPDYTIAIDSATRGIRGTAQYDGRTVGTTSVDTGTNQYIGAYEGRVTLVADFGAVDETGNSFTVSGRVDELLAQNRDQNNPIDAISTFSGFDLGRIDGDVVDGAIQTSQGVVSSGPNDVALNGTSGSLSGSWDISFHGRANPRGISDTNESFHLAPPVVAGNIRAEGTWTQSSTVADVTYDGVFGAYKTSDSMGMSASDAGR